MPEKNFKKTSKKRLEDIRQKNSKGELETAAESAGDMAMELGGMYASIGKNEKAGAQYRNAGDGYMIARNAYKRKGNESKAKEMYKKAVRTTQLMIEKHGLITASIFLIVGLFFSTPILTGNISSNSNNHILNIIGISLITIGITIFIFKLKK